MRDGNTARGTPAKPRNASFSLPMRDGNSLGDNFSRIVNRFSLPMRDGNKTCRWEVISVASVSISRWEGNFRKKDRNESLLDRFSLPMRDGNKVVVFIVFVLLVVLAYL